MPRYFFHIRNHVGVVDDTGTELANWHEARIEAVRIASETIRDFAERIALGEAWQVEVADESGSVLFRLQIATHEGPAMSRDRY